VDAGCPDCRGVQRQADCDQPSDDELQKSLKLRLMQAKADEIIEIPADKWTFNRALSLNKSNVTLRGAGPERTVLSFKGQLHGAEGLLVNAAEHITIENLAIEDTKGEVRRM
jgi:hypothetical protein